MLTSKIITKILENNSEFSVWWNSCNKLFKIYLDKPWNGLWYCYQKAHPPPVTPLLKGKGGQCPRHVTLACVHGVTLRDEVRSCEIGKALNAEPLLRIERLQLRWFGHLSKMPRERLAKQVRPDYTYGKAAKNQVEWLHLRPCFVPTLFWASRTIWLLLVMTYVESS